MDRRWHHRSQGLYTAPSIRLSSLFYTPAVCRKARGVSFRPFPISTFFPVFIFPKVASNVSKSIRQSRERRLASKSADLLHPVVVPNAALLRPTPTTGRIINASRTLDQDGEDVDSRTVSECACIGGRGQGYGSHESHGTVDHKCLGCCCALEARGREQT